MSKLPSTHPAQDDFLQSRIAFDDPKHHLRLYHGDCLEILEHIPDDSFDLVFADPPYFLSNGGITCHAGRMVSVNKGEWDKAKGAEANHEFNRLWLAACQRVLKPNGSIWVSGTAHVIHSVGFAMQQLGFKLLNDISWVKPNPPPNLSCRYFTHATETIIWAAKNSKSRHTFHYKLMKDINRGKQMKSVWEIYPPEAWEKKVGKHPTQKPVALLERILLASSHEGDLVLDPFSGSGTTLLAALRLRRHALGLDLDLTYAQLTARRLCSELAHVSISLSTFHSSVDLFSRSMDRSDRGFCSGRSLDRFFCSGRFPKRAPFSNEPMPPPLQLVQQERRFYFIGRADRRVIFDAAYSEMKKAILDDRTPNLYVLHYDLTSWTVQTVILIPHFAFALSAVERRRPLAATARRAGWVGCNIVLDKIPVHARIPIIHEGNIRPRQAVRVAYQRLRPLEKLQVEKRGWTLDVLQVVQSLNKKEFLLPDVYAHAHALAKLHPKNAHIRPKIRQQLQILRDLGLLDFLGAGSYRLR